MKTVVKIVSLLVFYVNTYCFAQEEIKDVKTWKKGVVNIDNRVIYSPYDKGGKSTATGFVVDKKIGILVTNKHVVNNAEVNETYVNFFNGKEVKTSLLYSDPIQDFSFLKVDPEKIPTGVIEFKLQGEFPKLNESVSIIGNNGGQVFPYKAA